MTTETATIIAGIICLALAIIGGNVVGEKYKIPKIPSSGRIGLSMLGTLLCLPWIIVHLPKKEVSGPPIGSIVAYGTDASTAPSEWLPCDGRALSRNDYPELFRVIGTLYGAGLDPIRPAIRTADFNLPDIRGRYPLGVSGSFLAGTTGGSSSIPAFSIPPHTHPLPPYTGSIASGAPFPGKHKYEVNDDNQGWKATNHLTVDGGDSKQEGHHAHSLGGSTATQKDSSLSTPATPHMPPYIALSYIIKAK